MDVYRLAKRSPKLRDADNYQQWANHILYVLRVHHNLSYELMTGQTQPPPPTEYPTADATQVLRELAQTRGVGEEKVTAEELIAELDSRDIRNREIDRAQQELYHNADVIAATLIIQTCEQSARNRIVNTTGCHNMWNELANQYKLQSFQAARFYLRKLTKLTYRPNGNPNGFVNKFRDLVRSIRDVEEFPEWIERCFFLEAIASVKHLENLVFDFDTFKKDCSMKDVYSGFISFESLQRS